MNLRIDKKEKIVPDCIVRVKDGFVKDKIGYVVRFDHTSKPPMWYIKFDQGWCGWHQTKNLIRLGEAQVAEW